MSSRLLQLGACVVYAAAAFPAAFAATLESELGAADGAALATVPFSAAFALAFLPWGRVADRIGYELPLVAALAGTAAGGAVFALAPDALTGGIGRAIAGAAAAAYPPAAQAALAAAAGDARSGRAIGGMMVAVAAGILGAPLVAELLSGAAGWRASAAVVGIAVPAACAVALARTRKRAAPPGPRRVEGARVAVARLPLAAGYAVAALVLGAQWTLLTRVDEVLGRDGLGLGGAVPQVVAAASGVAGIALVALCARESDRWGPRRPMVAVLLCGAVAAAVGAGTGVEAAAIAGLAAFLALYWGYLPVVSVQVIRSAPEALRATAIAGLYSSMWLGAALAGLAATAAPDWRALLAGAAVLWLAACAVAAAGFHRQPVGA